ncbi:MULTISPECIES: YidH family protein [Serratia]|uniref:YidH family protein n=1 Tax=Serratia TaxID=613 RepID=UPI001F4BF244|nr:MULTISPECIES: DUF202 domain-containing protein [Serratia]ULG11037.1 hypothetical protein 220p1_00155 [Serratia entomophila]CAI1955415.1 Inner membrane protein yidH [Serratia quinivorans]CAI2159013.1 Inner membrane protein yidH [Serratia quinivorans]
MTWWTQGKKPDYRFTLANERTFLAWIRTALTFMAAAVGLDQLTDSTSLKALIVTLALTAAILACYAYHRWAGNEKAMRHEQALGYPGLLIWLSAGLATGILITLAVLVWP